MNITKINNPLDIRDRVTITSDTLESTDSFVIDLIQKFFPEIISSEIAYHIAVNGKIIDPYTTKVNTQDFIAIIPVLEGSSKNIGAMIAMIALAVVAPYIAAPLAGLTTLTGTALKITEAAITTGIVAGGGLLINHLLPPIQTDDPKDNSITTYAWNATTTQRDRICKPRYYGFNKISGNIIMVYSSLADVNANQYLNVIMGLSMGPCKGLLTRNVERVDSNGDPVLDDFGDPIIDVIPEIKINDQYVEEYDSVETEEAFGYIGQEKFQTFEFEAVTGDSNAVTIEFGDPEIVTITRTGISEDFVANFQCPNGLYRPNNTGEGDYYKNYFVSLGLELKVKGADDSTYQHIFDEKNRSFEIFGFKRRDNNKLSMIVSNISTGDWASDMAFNLDNYLIPNSGYSSKPEYIMLKDLPDGILFDKSLDLNTPISVVSIKNLYSSLNDPRFANEWYARYGNSKGVNKGNKRQRYYELTILTTSLVLPIPTGLDYSPTNPGTPYGLFVDNQIVRSGRQTSTAYFQSPSIRYPSADTEFSLRIKKLNKDKLTKVEGAKEPSTSWGQKVQYYSTTDLTSYTSSFPRLACLGMKAIATKDVNGGFEVSMKHYGMLVRVWNGVSWSVEYSTNPAWIAYDILTQPVYLGTNPASLEVCRFESIDPSFFDLDSFLELAAYCDQQVPLSSGGFRTKHTHNGGIVEEDNVFEQASKILGNCRSQLVLDLSTGKFRVLIDRPALPTQMYSMGSIVEGSFKGTYLPRDQRATAIEARFLDADRDFEDTTMYVQSDLERSDRNVLSVSFYGITNIEEVTAEATYRLNRNTLITESFTFEVDIKGLTSSIGDVIYFQHEVAMPEKSGHILSISGVNVVVNKDIELEVGNTYYLYVHKRNQPLEVSTGQFTERIENKKILSAVGDTLVLELPFDTDPDPLDEFMIVKNEPKLYRITNIYRSNELNAEITVVEYNEDVYSESSVVVTPPAVTSPSIGFVRDLTATRRNGSIYINWNTPSESNNYYGAEVWIMYSSGENWTQLGTTQAYNYIFADVNPAVEYVIKIVSVYTTGQKSSFNTSPTYVVSSETGWVDPIIVHDITVTGLTIKGYPNKSIFQTKDVEFTWNTVSSIYDEDSIGDLPAGAEVSVAGFAYFEVVIENVDGSERRRFETTNAYYTYTYDNNYNDGNGVPARQFRIKVRAYDTYGYASEYASLFVNNPIPDALEGVTLQKGVKCLIFSWDIPDEAVSPDIAGYKVWSSTMIGFVPNDENNLIYQGMNNSIVIPTDVRIYVRVAAYDNFGNITSELNISPEFSELPLPPAGELTDYNLDYVWTSDFEITVAGNILSIPGGKYISFRDQSGVTVAKDTTLTGTDTYYVSFDFYGWTGTPVDFTVSTTKPGISYYKFLFATVRWNGSSWWISSQTPERMLSAAIFQAGSITTDLIAFNYATSPYQGGPATSALTSDYAVSSGTATTALAASFNYAGSTSKGGSAITVKAPNGTSTVSKTTAGLYLDGSGIGFHDGTQWMSYVSITGDSFFRKSCTVGNVAANNYMQFDAVSSKMTIKAQNVDIGTDNLRFYSDGTDSALIGTSFLAGSPQYIARYTGSSITIKTPDERTFTELNANQFILHSLIKDPYNATYDLARIGAWRHTTTNNVDILFRNHTATAYFQLYDMLGPLYAKLYGFTLENCTIASMTGGVISNSTLSNCTVTGSFAGSSTAKSSRSLCISPSISPGTDVELKWGGLLPTHWGTVMADGTIRGGSTYGSFGLVECENLESFCYKFTLSLYNEDGATDTSGNPIHDDRYIVFISASGGRSANTMAVANTALDGNGFFENGKTGNILLFRRDGNVNKWPWSFVAFRVFDRFTITGNL